MPSWKIRLYFSQRIFRLEGQEPGPLTVACGLFSVRLRVSHVHSDFFINTPPSLSLPWLQYSMVLGYMCFKEYSPDGAGEGEGPGAPHQGVSPSSAPEGHVSKAL